jgi:antitoxin component YwqK of YwqJK toxin-antitoxin module
MRTLQLLCAGVGMLVSAAGLATSASTVTDDKLHGEYSSYYPSGALYQVRRYVQGREHGLQQAWTESGELYINYEARGGRRYGFVNAKPCRPVEESQP